MAIVDERDENNLNEVNRPSHRDPTALARDELAESDREEHDHVTEPTNDWRDFKPRQLVDVRDRKQIWSEAQIVEVDEDRVFVHYLYADPKNDEWIPISSPRLAPYGTKVYLEGGLLREGQRIEVLRRNIWREAFVVRLLPNGVRVKYAEPSLRGFEDIELSGKRISPFGRNLCPLMHARILRERLQRGAPEQGNEVRRGRVRSFPTQSAHPQYEQYVTALRSRGLKLHSIEGDGNCLFRAFSHQIYGSDEYHALIRKYCIDYMELEKDYFKPYVVGDMEDFYRYLRVKRTNGVWGDDPEIQAMCELYDRPAQIFVFDRRYGAKLLRTFHEATNRNRPPIRFYGGGHYDSLIGEDFHRNLLREPPGAYESRKIVSRTQRTEPQELAPAEAGVEEALKASRRDFNNQWENLEAALKVSMDDYDQQQLALEYEQKALEDVAQTSELAMAQDALVEQAQKESEAEAIERAILDSLQTDAAHAESAEMARAIELSLGQDGLDGVVDDEESELSRAIALSMSDYVVGREEGKGN